MRKDYVKRSHLSCVAFYQVKEGMTGGCRPVNVKGLAWSRRAVEETVGGPSIPAPAWDLNHLLTAALITQGLRGLAEEFRLYPEALWGVLSQGHSREQQSQLWLV